MPAELPADLILSAIPEREDPRDALLGAALKEGARVGTSSLRRTVQLKAMHRGVSIETLRGNLDTRIRKLDEGQYDTIILAAAGLRRLGWADRIAELIPVDVMIPAVGQGALAIETRDDQGEAHRIAHTLEHEASRIAITAERAFLAVFGGGCQVPIGAHATIHGSEIHLRAFVSEPDGSNVKRGEETGSDPTSVGQALAKRLFG
jgi:hydroxymethylbilane synthase